MSTRSRIGLVIQHEWAETVRSIYCHHDGYPSHVGRLLLEHYDTLAKVEELLNLGSLSSLGEVIGEKHDFDWMQKMFADTRDNPDPSAFANHPDWKRFRPMCLAYGRDRGEKDVSASMCSLETFGMVAEESGADCAYLGFPEGNVVTWMVALIGSEPVTIEDFRPLTPQVVEWNGFEKPEQQEDAA